MRTSEQIDQIATALAAAQAEFLPVKKNRINPHFKAPYADLDSDIEATRTALTKYGIAAIQGIGNQDAEIRITTRLAHKSGQWMEDDFFVRPEKDSPQGRKSASTYGRRVGYEGMTGISPGDDDDGELAENRGKKESLSKDERTPLQIQIESNVSSREQLYNGCDNHKLVLAKLFAKHGVEESKLKAQLNMKCIGKPFTALEGIVVEAVR